MPAHSIYEFWDQSNSSSMDHITNQALLHLLPSHAPHCYLGYDFWVVTELLRGHGFVQLEIRHIVLFLLSFSMDLNIMVKECRELNKEGNNYGSVCLLITGRK